MVDSGEVAAVVVTVVLALVDGKTSVEVTCGVVVSTGVVSVPVLVSGGVEGGDVSVYVIAGVVVCAEVRAVVNIVVLVRVMVGGVCVKVTCGVDVSIGVVSVPVVVSSGGVEDWDVTVDDITRVVDSGEVAAVVVTVVSALVDGTISVEVTCGVVVSTGVVSVPVLVSGGVEGGDVSVYVIAGVVVCAEVRAVVNIVVLVRVMVGGVCVKVTCGVDVSIGVVSVPVVVSSGGVEDWDVTVDDITGVVDSGEVGALVDGKISVEVTCGVVVSTGVVSVAVVVSGGVED